MSSTKHQNLAQALRKLEHYCNLQKPVTFEIRLSIENFIQAHLFIEILAFA